MSRGWRHPSGVIRSRVISGYEDRVTPVVVIDAEDVDAIEALAKVYYDLGDDYFQPGPKAMSIRGYRMQAALREFADPKPPKPDEPKNYLAVVKTAGGRRYWRWSAGDAHTGQPWRLLGSVHADTEDDDGNWRWSDLSVVEIVSEGVTA